MARNPKVDEKIEVAAPFARPILEHLRDLVHRTVPDAGEAIKWGMPHFTYKDKNIAGMAAFKAHCAFMIHGEGRQGEGMGSFGKIESLSDLPPDDDIVAKLKKAMTRIDEEGSAIRKRESSDRRVEPLAVPDDLGAALAGQLSAQEFFDSLSPSARNEYVSWITEAKREGTRARRIIDTVRWLGEGKRRNWKYES